MNARAGLLIALVLAAGAAAWYGMQGPDGERAPPPSASSSDGPTIVGRREIRYPPGAPQLDYLRSEPARAMPEPLIEPLNGRVAYDENRTVRVSSPIAGRVLKVGAEPGDRVAAGQAIAWLDAPDYAAARADVARAEAEVRQQQAALARAKLLFEGEVLPRRELERAEAEHAQAVAEAQRARGRLANLTRGAPGASTGDFRLVSPLTGVVTERRVNAGNEVRPDLPEPLFVITDPTSVWVLIELPERLLGRVAKAQDVIVEADAYPGEQLKGTIAQVGDVVDAATRRVLVRCVVANLRRLLKPEMFVRVTPIPDEHARFVRLPNTAIITLGVQPYVFVEREPGVFEKRPVRLGLQARDHSFVREGVAEGERVVVTGVLRLNAELAGNQ